MHVFFYCLEIILIIHHSEGDATVDFKNAVDEQRNIQSYPDNSLVHTTSNNDPAASQQNVPMEFTCQSEGRFPDLSDSTCMRYFQCERMNDGTFNKKSLTCPNSTFCSTTRKCSSVYVCPCGSTNSEVQVSSNSQETTAKITANPCSAGTVTDFDCSSIGRFPDTSDVMCQTYFLCSHLHNGSYVKTTYKCRNSFFDPVIKRCSANFTCPCSYTTSASTVTFTTLTSQYLTNGTVSTVASASSPTTPESATISSIMTSNILSTEHGCTIVSTEFECLKEGRFPDLSDITCRNYFLCSKLRNGTFIKTPYTCMYSSFNPLTLRCSTSYLCPCAVNQTTSEVTPTSSDSPGSFTTLPATTKIITSSSSSSLSTHEENKSTATNPVGSSSSAISSVSTTAAACISSSIEFECATEGRFADVTDFTCTKYFLCSHLRNGTLIRTKYRCPNTSKFYPLLQRCSSEYNCPCFTPTTTILPTSSTKASTTTVESNVPTSTTFLETTTTSKSSSVTPIENVTVLTTSLPISSETPTCKVYLDDFVCHSKGRFPDLSDITCQNYFLCSLLNNGSFIKTKYRCPNLSNFYPPSEKCSTTYVCPCAVTTGSGLSTTLSSINMSTVENAKTTTTYFSEIPVTSLIPSAYPTAISTSSSSSGGCTVSNKEFQCTVAGRFPDLSDTTCTKYFLCSKLRNETFIKTSYTCLNSTFNPLLLQCALSYVCPCNVEYTSLTTPMQSISTSEGFTKLPTTTISVLLTTTASYICNSLSENVPEFICSSVGRFPDYSDSSCRKYFLCSQLHNGTFLKTPYNCPASSCISSSIQRCSFTCTCPCLK